MLLRLVKTALVAAWLLQFAHAQSSNAASGQLIPSPTTTPVMNALTKVGCFSTPTPMVDHGPYTFQSSGNCQPICYGLQQPVMGLVNGTNCWCGPLLPPKDAEVSNSSCNTPCAGIDTEMCGGDNFWTVYLTGVTRNQIQNLDPASASASSTTSATGTSTVVVTAGPTGGSGGKAGGGPSTVGIAVGVVVGLIAIGGIAIGGFLWYRRNRTKEAEDEYKRQNAIANFVEGGKASNGGPSNDSRLDPHVFAARRDSTGSIADNADYSRRILQVRNPDDF